MGPGRPSGFEVSLDVVARRVRSLAPDWRVFAFIAGLAVLACLLFGLSPALKATGTNPTQTMLMISLFKNSMPTYAEQWEKLTGVKMQFIEYGYTDIPAKIMAESVAKTGQYDIFNQFPYVIPDAAGAGVLMPLDAYAEKGKPDFSSIEPALRDI